ncbi:hypothetical protein [Candidatus Poriferisodalis sp.]|uniref:hypothetical protein n=1 Tax=Candidatus Poriferisodalis sp. TaxID=3101277 RepID=UPI003B014541
MLLWFVATSLAAMRWTFADTAIDHRLIVAGALLPDVLHAAARGAPLAHSLVFPVCGLGVVMLATIGRRRPRRRWLALPIGVFWHQLFDGAWMQPSLLWWPFAGSTAATTLPLASRGVWLICVMELAGLLGCWWIWRSSDLSRDPQARARFWRTGRLAYSSSPRSGRSVG